MPISSGPEVSYSSNARKGELGQQGYTALRPGTVYWNLTLDFPRSTCLIRKGEERTSCGQVVLLREWHEGFVSILTPGSSGNRGVSRLSRVHLFSQEGRGENACLF